MEHSSFNLHNSDNLSIPHIPEGIIDAQIRQKNEPPEMRYDKMKSICPELARYALIMAERSMPRQTNRKGDFIQGAMAVVELFQRYNEVNYLNSLMSQEPIVDDGDDANLPLSIEQNDDQLVDEPSRAQPDQ